MRSNRVLARVIVKLASPEILSREWQAYRDYVADILPQVIAHIQGAPLLSPDRKLGLLRYTFAGDVGGRRAESLAVYYRHHTGQEIAGLLERNIFQAAAPDWWLNREADLFPLRQEYDSLLPVHLVVERTSHTTTLPVTLKAGGVTVQEVRYLEAGREVQLQGFRVLATRPERQEMVLGAPAPGASGGERLRLLLVGLLSEELDYKPGDLGPNFTGTIVAARHHLLVEAARAAYPVADLFLPTLAIGAGELPNPLHRYEQYLEQPISGMKSIIHGSLTLDSILVEPESGLTWLINFSETRQGHNLYDFIRLEVEVISRLIAPLLAEAGLRVGDEVIAMVQVLHRSTPPAAAPDPALQKPYELLCAIRRMVGRCLQTPSNWDEYYLGLVMLLLGTLPVAPETGLTRTLLFTWAAVACRLVGQPLFPPIVEQDITRPRQTSHRLPYLALAGIGGVALVMVVGALLLSGLPGLTAPTTSPAIVVAATAPPSATPIPTLLPVTPATIPPPPPPGILVGRLAGDLNIYQGPGEEYEIIGTVSQGRSVQITGQNQAGNWWQIAYPDAPGGYAWIKAEFVQVAVTGTPVLPVAKASPPPTVTSTPSNTPTPTDSATPTATPTRPTPTATRRLSPTPTRTPKPLGTPTAPAGSARQFAGDTEGYRQLSLSIGQRFTPSMSFSPDGSQLAVTEGAKLYTVARDSSSGHIWMEEDEKIRPVEGVVWSPDGRMLAFVADRKQNCGPCRLVAILLLTNGEIYYLEPPAGQAIGLPRWTQDGRLLVTVYTNDPAGGATYIYDVVGRGQPASGTYVLSSSHEGQKWFPWKPGKPWQVNPAEPHRYYDD